MINITAAEITSNEVILCVIKYHRLILFFPFAMRPKSVSVFMFNLMNSKQATISPALF
jgi:hypothetical protein